jgi:hypothetical protein
MPFVLDHFQDIVLALGNKVFPEGILIWDGTTTINFKKSFQFFIVQNICGHQSIVKISGKKSDGLFEPSDEHCYSNLCTDFFCSKFALLVYACRGR